MGHLSNKIAKGLGMENRVIHKKESPEQIKKRKEYGEKVKNYQKIVNNRPVPKYKTLTKIWNHYAKEITKSVGKELIIDKDNIDFIRALNYYFCKDEVNFKKNIGSMCKNEPSINKGLFIAGPYGCGKTLSMLAMRKALQTFEGAFSYKSTVEVVAELDNKNQKIDYSNRTYFFDDLGQEKKHYGNEVFADLLFQRYDLFRNKGKKTHITSNLNIEQIEDRYGQYISSRFYEMFNIIYVGGVDRRKK